MKAFRQHGCAFPRTRSSDCGVPLEENGRVARGGNLQEYLEFRCADLDGWECGRDVYIENQENRFADRNALGQRMGAQWQVASAKWAARPAGGQIAGGNGRRAGGGKLHDAVLRMREAARARTWAEKGPDPGSTLVNVDSKSGGIIHCFLDLFFRPRRAVRPADGQIAGGERPAGAVTSDE